MPARTAFISKLIGLYALIFGVAMLVNRPGTIVGAGALLRDPGLVLLSGIFALSVGLAILLAHNVWSGGALPIVVTVIGWLAILKGLVLIFLSQDALAGYVQAVRFEQSYYVYAVVTLALGAYLTYGGFKMSRAR
jgi:hypothetical protein